MNDIPLLDTELPLQATLLYENGLPVKQLSNSEPLLVGEPEVVALQGSAVFKLRITSLSSHRDKQRFRIQIAPQNPLLRHNEPALTIVTDPMKSVTKLAHRSTGATGAPSKRPCSTPHAFRYQRSSPLPMLASQQKSSREFPRQPTAGTRRRTISRSRPRRRHR